MKKTCFRCREEKSISDFYLHKKMKDGHLNKCKECTILDVRLYRRNNDRVREYDKKRWKENPDRRKKASLISSKWRKENPDKYKAQTMLNNAIRDKRVVRMACCMCGKKAHAHHEDYTKPFSVIWLCPMHHQRLHHKF